MEGIINIKEAGESLAEDAAHQYLTFTRGKVNTCIEMNVDIFSCVLNNGVIISKHNAHWLDRIYYSYFVYTETTRVCTFFSGVSVALPCCDSREATKNASVFNNK